MPIFLAEQNVKEAFHGPLSMCIKYIRNRPEFFSAHLQNGHVRPTPRNILIFCEKFLQQFQSCEAIMSHPKLDLLYSALLWWG